MKRLLALIISSIFALLLVPQAIGASFKVGASCKVLGENKSKNNLILECTKKGKKLAWREVKSSQTKLGFQFNSVCQVDPDTPEEWKEVEKFLSTGGHCPSFFKYVPYNVPDTKPTSTITNFNELPAVDTCKVRQPSGQFYPWRGFADPSDSRMISYYQEFASPRPKMKIQMVPITWEEYPSDENPAKVNGKIINFVKEWIENSSDNGSDVRVNFPNKYFMMPKPLSQYKDISIHGQPTPARAEFWRDVITVTDPSIDYQGVTLSIVVVPPVVPLEKFAGNPDGNGLTNEGRIQHMMTISPLNLTQVHRNAMFFNPHMILHQMSHAGLDIGDYYNAGFWPSVGNGTSDQLSWDKYLEGFMSDSQIRCASKDQTSTHWLVPSAAKGSYEKLLVVPLSKTKILAVESMRAAGYRYKLPRKMEGALVYTVDTSITEHGYGTEVIRPSRARIEPSDGAKQDAALKVGESITFEGVKISVIESGSFGDVIKVEKS